MMRIILAHKSFSTTLLRGLNNMGLFEKIEFTAFGEQWAYYPMASYWASVIALIVWMKTSYYLPII